MANSQSLQLVLASAALNEQISSYLSQSLQERGYAAATPALLHFLSALECDAGANYASEIARTLGVSRQMVAKTVKELCRVGYLEQVDGQGKQKQIFFTELGEQLMSDCRMILAELDNLFAKKIGKKKLAENVELLAGLQAVIASLTTLKG